MNLHQFLSLFAFVAMMLSPSSGSVSGQSRQEFGLNMYCGRNLARALAVLCTDDGVVKAADRIGSMYNEILTPYYKEQDAKLNWPWLLPQKAREIGLPYRGKRLVVSECCDKPCSVSELLSYC